HSLAGVTPLAIESGKVEFDHTVHGHTGGAEIVDSLTEEEVVHTAKEAKALLSAKAAPTGTMNVVLDPSTTGTFAHESFGHGTEADQLLRGRSYLQPLLGQEVAPECLTLVDNGALPGGWGTIYFDDEGHPAQRTVLVDRGRFVEVLMDRECAAELHRAPTGNTRRADFLSRPFVRMTNTYVEPGEQTMEELIRETKNGVLLQNFTSGIEDPLGGNMQLKVKKGRRIENGELTEIFSSMALSGKVLEFLRAIRGVSKATDMGWSPGFCGKGQTDMLMTGTGGPYLASRAVVGPA
ncbi:MAG: TldD/PmbA family protein, partial [Thermoplasmata archaeon]|nr:TldD/PmbA family protein [Thermoplasmata archaeon]